MEASNLAEIALSKHLWTHRPAGRRRDSRLGRQSVVHVDREAAHINVIPDGERAVKYSLGQHGIAQEHAAIASHIAPQATHLNVVVAGDWLDDDAAADI